MTTLFTIGYEKATPAAVMAELKRARVDTLVDTRAVAASRRPGFSKRQLAAGLDEAGIAYIHLQKLGTPAEGRQAARAGDIDTLWRIYDRAHRKSPSRRKRSANWSASSSPASGSRFCATAATRKAATAAASWRV